mmetsp:Transcript_28262/g.84559  ORF Transcript_28262/g.84559 Transcript_28262/m.84559 type:complete len:282 (+) Transcript_28262:40-885(+)
MASALRKAHGAQVPRRRERWLSGAVPSACRRHPFSTGGRQRKGRGGYWAAPAARRLLFGALASLSEVSLTLAAKRSEHNVSGRQSLRGEMLTIIRHFESFPRASCSTCVSFESRYGMWADLVRTAWITDASVDNDLLMASVSVCRLDASSWRAARSSSGALLIWAADGTASRSDPARSTMLTVECTRVPEVACTPSSVMRHTECDRDDRAFISVAPTERCETATSSNRARSPGARTTNSRRLAMIVRPSLPILTVGGPAAASSSLSPPSPSPSSRSRICSL